MMRYTMTARPITTITAPTAIPATVPLEKPEDSVEVDGELIKDIAIMCSAAPRSKRVWER
jgi:hypothetical protein